MSSHRREKNKPRSKEFMCPAQIYILYGKHRQDFSFQTASQILYGTLRAKWNSVSKLDGWGVWFGRQLCHCWLNPSLWPTVSSFLCPETQTGWHLFPLAVRSLPLGCHMVCLAMMCWNHEPKNHKSFSLKLPHSWFLMTATGKESERIHYLFPFLYYVHSYFLGHEPWVSALY